MAVAAMMMRSGGEDRVYDYDDEWKHIPIQKEARLEGHKRAVSAVDVEHSGSRVATGAHDGHVQMFDFNGMKRDMQSFRNLYPCGSYQVKSLSWSPSGELLLVTPSSSSAVILNRDGIHYGEFVKGDMYIRDMKNTKGHVAALTCGKWNKANKNKLMTASEDGTVRIWDPTRFHTQISVLKATKTTAMKPSVTSCCWSQDGKLIIGGMKDGTLQLWDAASSRSAAVGVVNAPRQQMVMKQDWTFAPNARTVIRKAHVSTSTTDDVTISSVCLYDDNYTLASRCLNGSLKLWDIRKYHAPLKSKNDIPATCEETSVSFSPDGTLLVTPTSKPSTKSTSRNGFLGSIVFLDRSTLEIVRAFEYNEDVSSVACCCWNSNINQIFVGCGITTTSTVDAKRVTEYQGFTSVLYDPEYSSRGAINSVSRSKSTKDITDLALMANINRNLVNSVVVHNNQHSGRKRGRDNVDVKAAKAMVPKQPIEGRGEGGRSGATHTSLLAQKIMLQTHDNTKGTLLEDMNKDPRELLLRFADKPNVFTAAYDVTQPETILQQSYDDDDDNISKQPTLKKESNSGPPPR